MVANPSRPTWRFAAATVLVLGLGGCNALTRLSEVGDAPKMSTIEDPTKAPGYQPVSMPMPAPVAPSAGANSLWRPGARGFFKDQRAAAVGDILTVAVNITESAKLQNNTTATRGNSESATFDLLGLESSLPKVFANTNTAAPWAFGGNSTIAGTGQMTRQEQVVVNVAATISQRLPNGNLVITGKQELRINNELREVSVTGVIRPEDITSVNTISSDKIAEARITYGGRGTLSDVQQARYGQQIFDIIAPF